MTPHLARLLLLASLLALPAIAAEPGAVNPGFTLRLTTSWGDQPTGKVTVRIQPGMGDLRLNPVQGGVDFAVLAPHGKTAQVTLTPEQPRTSFIVAQLPIPEKGDDFALILGGKSANDTAAWLLPSGLSQFPSGSAYVINRSVSTIRISFEDQFVVVEKGAFKLHPLVVTQRLAARFKIEAQTGAKWSLIRTSRIILNPDVRMVLLIGPMSNDSDSYAIGSVIDVNPGANEKAAALKK
jgi:hypothetical protein